MSITAEEVLWCYRLLLGREPESEAVMARALEQPHREALVQSFLDSDEFGRQGVNHRSVLSSLNRFEGRPLAVEVDVTPAQLEALLRRVKACWQRLGQTQPHWSVMSNEKFRPQHIEQSLKQFWNTGQHPVKALLAILARVGFGALSDKTCLEYGCGMGRMTGYLAASFGQVLGYDISASHLALANERRAALGIGNIDYRLVADDPLAPLPACDVCYSRLVLQHNPPPLIALLIGKLLAALKPGGIAVLQLSTYSASYRFSVDDYLATPPDPEPAFEIHHLPQAEVFRRIAQQNCRVLEVHEDGAAGDAQSCVSNLFVVQKAG